MEIIKQKVVSFFKRPFVKKAQQQIIGAAVISEEKILALPRPLNKVSDEKVNNLLSKSVIGLFLGIYMTKSGKALAFNVKDRQLNKYGKVGATISLVVQPIVILLTIHELWARLRKPMTLEELMAGHLPGFAGRGTRRTTD